MVLAKESNACLLDLEESMRLFAYNCVSMTLCGMCVEAGGIVGMQTPLVGCHMVSSLKKMIRFESIETEGVKESAKKPKSS